MRRDTTPVASNTAAGANASAHLDKVHSHHASCYWPKLQLNGTLPIRKSWHNETILVPSVFLEWRRPPAWLRRQLGVYEYQRHDEREPCYVPNHGFESSVYVRFVADHYENLPAHVVFAQADWFSAWPRPHSPGLQAAMSEAYGQHGAPVEKGFDFWQLACVSRSHDDQWRNYLPLGKHHRVWPPQFFYHVSPASSGSHADRRWWREHGNASKELILACLRQLLVVDFEITRPPLPEPFLSNFHINNNFIVSRTNIHRHSNVTYARLAARFARGLCVETARTPDRHADHPRYHKLTVGVTMERLADAVWGRKPPHNAEGVSGFVPTPQRPYNHGWPLPKTLANC